MNIAVCEHKLKIYVNISRSDSELCGISADLMAADSSTIYPK